MNKICKNCKWWDRNSDISIQGKLDCLKVGKGEKFAIYSGIGVGLHTSPDFGCICWERKKLPTIEDVKGILKDDD